MVNPEVSSSTCSVQCVIANGNTVVLPVPVGPWTSTILGDKACMVFFTIAASFISGRYSGGVVPLMQGSSEQMDLD